MCVLCSFVALFCFVFLLFVSLVALSSHELFVAVDGASGRASNAAAEIEEQPAAKDDSGRERVSAGNREHQGRR